MVSGVPGHIGLPAVKLAVTGQQNEQENATILLHLAAARIAWVIHHKARIVWIVNVQVGVNRKASIQRSCSF